MSIETDQRAMKEPQEFPGRLTGLAFVEYVVFRRMLRDIGERAYGGSR